MEIKRQEERTKKNGPGTFETYISTIGRGSREVDPVGPAERPAELWTHSGFLQVVPAGGG